MSDEFAYRSASAASKFITHRSSFIIPFKFFV